MGKPQSNFQHRTIFGVPLIAGNVSAMSSGGFRTTHYHNTTNDNRKHKQ